MIPFVCLYKNFDKIKYLKIFITINTYIMKYLKKFENHDSYELFITSGDYPKPNVSYCVEQNEVHYNPIVDARLIVTYNVEDASQPTLLYFYDTKRQAKGADMFDKVEIDNTEVLITDLDTNNGSYQLSVGEHTVAYTLKDPTLIGYDPNDPEGMAFGALFTGCERITDAIIPNSVTSINAFDGCSSLTSVTIPNSVTSIGNSAFRDCSGLASVTIPSSVTSIDNFAFTNCFGLTSMNIPNSVTNIGDSAFYGCTSLTSITIGDGVTSISHQVFYNCTSLTSVTIGNSVTSIGSNAFYNCSSLTSITSLAMTAPTIKSSTFQNIKTNGTLTVPSGSSDYDVWMGTSNYYLGKYNWTKTEQ